MNQQQDPCFLLSCILSMPHPVMLCLTCCLSPSYSILSGMARWDLCSYGWCHLSWQGTPAPCASNPLNSLGEMGFKSLITLACAPCTGLKFHSFTGYHHWKHHACTECRTLQIHSLLTSKQLHFSWITQRHFPAITIVRPNFGLPAAVVAIKEH